LGSGAGSDYHDVGGGSESGESVVRAYFYSTRQLGK
jgi:hypothetical protein